MIISADHLLALLIGIRIFDNYREQKPEDVFVSQVELQRFAVAFLREIKGFPPFYKKKLIKFEFPTNKNRFEWESIFRVNKVGDEELFYCRKEAIKALHLFYVGLHNIYPLPCIRRAAAAVVKHN